MWSPGRAWVRMARTPVPGVSKVNASPAMAHLWETSSRSTATPRFISAAQLWLLDQRYIRGRMGELWFVRHGYEPGQYPGSALRHIDLRGRL